VRRCDRTYARAIGGTSQAQRPPPLPVVALSVAALLISVLVLAGRERAYERDPQLRARAGLVDANSDISLMRPANFRRALAVVSGRTPRGGTLSGLSVTPTEVGATILSASGAETILTITPGIHVETIHPGDRFRDRHGISPATIPPGGPARILAAAERRFDLRPLEFDRLELDLPIGKAPAYWSASWTEPADDDGVLAALDGGHLRRPFGGRR
jgi:hypothetical protein